ncbi:polyphosphate polymerase domain-containing protein [Solwaraspora sp. WMMD1047]|uniref:polyphosphate polymerase domain-containing protein n=1 Tax=Solwaraspora sp. WMMD1047 TaxID=3016102 RepID=UPI0024162C59|nr:polyphosphate polymerase domain-containing protein [Solwaraspora sp. WMMD1047]MDG4830902.1 polyphosphate polymerase domain-containing protein [Solwaraspora sp. WMMD1047]
MSTADMDSIGLVELTERAALQARFDRKYLLPVALVPELLVDIAPQARILEIDGIRSFAYESIYFDTPAMTSYLLTAHRRRRRFKVRTRTYLDSAQCWLEVKLAGARGDTVKHRFPYLPEHGTTLAPGREFVDGILDQESIGRREQREFVPVLRTRYQRSTLYLPATDSRVTIDTDLTWQDDRAGLRLPTLAVIETKTSSVASRVDRLLWQRGHRPVRISKYATGLAALRPDLPAVPWRRTLRRHFTVPAQPTDLAILACAELATAS